MEQYKQEATDSLQEITQSINSGEEQVISDPHNTYANNTTVVDVLTLAPQLESDIEWALNFSSSVLQGLVVSGVANEESSQEIPHPPSLS